MKSYDRIVLERAAKLLFAIMFFFALLLLVARADAQTTPYALMPIPRQCFVDASGNPLSLGMVYSYQAGTSTPLATYSDNSGSYQNPNPVPLDAAGCATIWLGGQAYKISVANSLGSQIYMTDNVSDLGQLLYAKVVFLSPANAAEQDVAGPLGANYFKGLSAHTTSPNVRVALLDPLFTLDTTSNPPNVSVTSPAAASQVYTIPDPGTATGAFIISPGQTTNTLDCSATGITCKRTAYAYLEGAGCNNTTASLGWDNFGVNAPTPICVSGANVQKGVMALPAAATRVQEATGTGAAAGTCTLTYPNTTVAGDLLVAEIAVDGGKTVSGITDGTNAYTKAINQTNGNFDAEIWYFNGASTSMAGGTTLTATLSAAANCAISWHEYAGIKTATLLDATGTGSGATTAVSIGPSAGTAQNTELVLAAVAAASNPTVTAQNGWVRHAVVAQSTNVTVASEGLIQQATTTQTANMTLGSAQTWAGVLATFKVLTTNSTVVAQRSLAMPSTWDLTRAVNSTIKWQAPLQPTGTVNVKLGAALGCTADGSTDDPALNGATTATALVNASSANILTTTALNALTTTGCAASNMLHYQIERLRYDANDTYEGYVYVNGASLAFGVTQ